MWQPFMGSSTLPGATMGPRASTGRDCLAPALPAPACTVLGAGSPAPDPRADVLQPSCSFQWKKPHFVAFCPKRTQLVPVPPSVSHVYSQYFLGAAPAGPCPRALTWAFPVSHLLSLCPCLLQRREVRPPDGHLDLHRRHEHPEALRPRGNARWVLARGAGGSWARSLHCWRGPSAVLLQFLPPLPRPEVLPALPFLSLPGIHHTLEAAPEGSLFLSALEQGIGCG